MALQQLSCNRERSPWLSLRWPDSCKTSARSMAEASCLASLSKVKKKNATPMRGLDLRCRMTCCIAVEHKTDLPHPAKPWSHRKELGFISHGRKGLSTNQSPVSGYLFLQA